MTFVEQSLVGHLCLQYQFIMIVIAIVNISRSTNCLFQICICFAGIGKYIIRTMCILSHIHITVISTGSLDLQSLHERYVILYRSGCLKCLVIGLTIPYDIRVGHGYRIIVQKYFGRIIRIVVGKRAFSGPSCTRSFKDIKESKSWCFLCIVTSANQHFGCQVFTQFSTQVTSECILFIIETIVLHNTIIGQIAQTKEKVHVFAPTGHREIVLLLKSAAFHSFVIPIGAFVSGCSLFPFHQLFFRKDRFATCIDTCLILNIHKLSGIHHFGYIRRFLPTEHTTIVETWLSFLSFFSCHKNNTVCSIQTINGCRGIFQDGDTFNICRIQSLKFT